MDSPEPKRPVWILRTVAVLALIVLAFIFIDYPSETEMREQYRQLPSDKRKAIDEAIIRLSDLKPEERRELDELRACYQAAPACALTSEQLAKMVKYEQVELQQSYKRNQSAQGAYEPLPEVNALSPDSAQK